MGNDRGHILFRLSQEGTTWTSAAGCDLFKITKPDLTNNLQNGRLSWKNDFRDATLASLGNEIRIDVIVRVWQSTNIGQQGYITLFNNMSYIDFMINHILKL